VLDLQGKVLARVGEQRGENGMPVLQRRGQPDQTVFNAPTEIAVAGNEVVVMDSGGSRIRVMDLQGKIRSTFRALDGHNQLVDTDNGLAIDTERNVYVSFVGSCEIRVYDPDGTLLAGFGQQGFRAGEFFSPRGLWIDGDNRLFVADTRNIRVQLFELGRLRLKQ
jgi:DNA-binding beta-propeller fold protein YncE